MKISQPHRTVRLIVLPAALILLGCNFLSEALNPATPTPVNCFDASSAPTDSDIDYALDFTADTFKNDPWVRSHREQDDGVTVTWQNNIDYSITHVVVFDFEWFNGRSYLCTIQGLFRYIDINDKMNSRNRNGEA